MAREIPEVVRAAAGLAATVLDEARKLPETLPGLPVRLAGLAMQSAMKVQQHYAGLVARGDELFTGIRGENEPGLATFDDEEEPAASPGFRDSAFDRAGADHVEDARTTIEELAEEAPSADEILDELAIDEMVGDTPATAASDADTTADVSTTVDAVTPAGEVASVDATVTDEGVAAAETPGGQATAIDESGTAVAATTDVRTDAGDTDTSAENGAVAGGAAVVAPVDGYDSFSIAQLRGRLRGYQLVTVQDLLTYEEATRAREPYLRMLRNRLERVEQQAVESSPLAPRG